jgi:phenylacetate-CoA ligase
LWGAAWYWRRFGRHYRDKVRELEEQERFTHDEFARLQLRSLNTILEHARRAPYYRQLFEDTGVPLPLSSLDDLRQIPTLSKQTVRVRSRDLLTARPPRGTQILRSSGTTGTPVAIYFTRHFHQQALAYFHARLRKWAGIGERDRRAMFGVRRVCSFDQARPPFWRPSHLENLRYYSIYHLSPQYLPHYVRHLREWKPRVIMGYPSALNVVARFLLDSGESLQIPVAITTSETVTEPLRNGIEQAFNCRLVDQYGSVENAHFASQCEYGRYHVSPERGIVEILNDGVPCAPGQEGRVVVTGFDNWLQPLIRYELGDVAYWAIDQTCPCGRQMPILGGIQGRHEDYCLTRDGRRVLRFDGVYKGITSILEGQIIQEDRDRFTIQVVPCSGFSQQDRQQLLKNFHDHMGSVQVDVVTTDNIPRTSSGKFRGVINRCPTAS